MSTLTAIVSEYTALVTRIDVLRIYPLLESFSQAVTNIGGLVPNVVNFVDGKPWPTCRPHGDGTNDPHLLQFSFYNGYYRSHGIKMQNVMWVDGIRLVAVSSIRDHDQHLFDRSQFDIQMSTAYINGDLTRPAMSYGDPAYREGTHFRRKHKGQGRTNQQRKLDSSMQQPRASVEDGFGKHVQLFSLMDYSKKNKLLQNPLTDQLIAQTFFVNIHTCLYGSIVNATFGVSAPEIDSYLQNAHLGYIP